MRRVIPSGYVSTGEAIHEMINADSEWCRLSEAWEQAGRPMDARYHEFGARQTVLTDALRAAVAAREISALAMVTTGDGPWAELELPRAYWNEIVGDLALIRGLVVGQGLAEADRKRFEDAALCFRRVDWQRWLARTVRHLSAGPLSANVAPGGAQSTYWTAVQACVWITTGDYEAVGRIGAFCTLLAAGDVALPPDRDVGGYREHVDDDIRTRVWGAWRDLAAACASGSLRMLGRLNGEGDSVAIPQEAWANLLIRDDSKRGMVAASPDVWDAKASWWDELRAFRQTIEEIGPTYYRASAAPALVTVSPSSPDEAQAAAVALTAELSKRVNSGEPRDRDTMLGWLGGEFPDLSKTDRADLYKAMPKDLKRARRGRPPGS